MAGVQRSGSAGQIRGIVYIQQPARGMYKIRDLSVYKHIDTDTHTVCIYYALYIIFHHYYATLFEMPVAKLFKHVCSHIHQ